MSESVGKHNTYTYYRRKALLGRTEFKG